jgi:hypothetical protein
VERIKGEFLGSQRWEYLVIETIKIWKSRQRKVFYLVKIVNACTCCEIYNKVR